jgi:hypothetical protein
MSEAKDSQMAIITKLVKHKKDVENSLGAFRSALAEIRKEINVDSINSLLEKLDAAARDSTSRLGEPNSRLDTLQEQVTAAGHVAAQHTMGNRQKDSESCIEVGQPPTGLEMNGSQHSNGRLESGCVSGYENTNDATILSNAPDIRANRDSHGYTEEGISHCHGSILDDLSLPKFSDRNAQNVVQFLSDLGTYFRMKTVPESVSIPLGKKAVVDSYTSQWLNTVYNDLTGYEQFKEAITNLLWGPQTQARLRCSLYQNKYDKAKDGSMSAHFL